MDVAEAILHRLLVSLFLLILLFFFCLGDEIESDVAPIVPPGPGNPLGARALYLGDTLYRIHGTNRPASIGAAVSHGCFRMFNQHIVELYNKVQIGANVYVVP